MKQQNKLICSNWHNNLPFSYKSRQITIKYHRLMYFVYSYQSTHKYKFVVNPNKLLLAHSDVQSHNVIHNNKIVPFGFVLYSNLKKWCLRIQYQSNYCTLFSKQDLIWKLIRQTQNYYLLHYSFDSILLQITNLKNKLWKNSYTTLLIYSINLCNQIYKTLDSILLIIPITFLSNKPNIQNISLVNYNLNISFHLTKQIKSIFKITGLFFLSLLIYKFNTQSILKNNVQCLAHITYKAKDLNFNNKLYSSSQILCCNESTFTNTNQSIFPMLTNDLPNQQINFSDLFIVRSNFETNLNEKTQLSKYSENIIQFNENRLNNLNYFQKYLINRNKNSIYQLEQIILKLTVFEQNILNINDLFNNLKHKFDLDKNQSNLNMFNLSSIKNNTIMIHIFNILKTIITNLDFMFKQVIDQIENHKYLSSIFFRAKKKYYINTYLKTSTIGINKNNIHLKSNLNILLIHFKNICKKINQYNNISFAQLHEISQLIQHILILNIYKTNKWFIYFDLQDYDISNQKFFYKINKLNNKLTRFRNIQINYYNNYRIFNIIDFQLYWLNKRQIIDTIQSLVKLVVTPKYNFYHHVLYTSNLNHKQISNQYGLKIRRNLNSKLHQTLNQYLYSQINTTQNFNIFWKNTKTRLYRNLFFYQNNLNLLNSIKKTAYKLNLLQTRNNILHTYLKNNFYITNHKWNDLWMTIPKIFMKSNEVQLFAKLLSHNLVYNEFHYTNNLIWSFASIYSPHNLYESTYIVNKNKIDIPTFNTKYEPILFKNYFQLLSEIKFPFNQIYYFDLYHQTSILKQYRQWFLTTKWWVFWKTIIKENTSLIQQYNYDGIYHSINFMLNQFNIWNYKFNLWLISLTNEFFSKHLKYFTLQFWFPLQKQVFHFQKQLMKSTKYYNRMWMSFQSNTKFNGMEWCMISILILGSAVCIYNLSSFIIFNQFFLWKKCEYIYNLTYPSWNLQFQILFFKHILSPLERTHFQTIYLLSQIMSIQHKYYSGWIGSIIIPRLTLQIQALDLSLKHQDITIQSLLQINSYNNRLKMNQHINKKSNYKHIFEFKNTWNPHLNYDINNTFNPFKSLILASSLNCVNLNSLAFQFPINLKQNLHNLIFKIRHNLTYLSTICLDLSDQKSDHILLVSSKKINSNYFQYLIPKYFNIIKISIDKLISQNIQNQSEEIRIKESLKKIAIILNLSQVLGNCIIWIPDLHKLCSYSFHHKIELIGNFILSSILRNILSFQKNNILHKIYFVGSTNRIEQLDSALIYPHKFNFLIYIRALDMFYREQMLLTFINNSKYKFHYKSNQLSKEIGNRTRGYDWNDLIGLANEIALITITQNTCLINLNTLKLAMYKQVSTINNLIPIDTFQRSYYLQIRNFPANLIKHFVIKKQLFYYKIGKAIISNMLINSYWIGLFGINNIMWKTRFYYLLQTYLELNMSYNSITIIVIFPIILNCLAGLAARDAWISSTHKLMKNGFNLIHEIENDIKLASGLLGGLFSSMYFCDIKYSQLKQQKQLMNISKKNSSKTKSIQSDQYNLKCINHDNMFNIHNTILSYNPFHQSINEKSLSDIQWGYRMKRFQICKNPMFNYINTIEQYIFSPLSHKSKISLETESINLFKYVPYGRNLVQVEEKQQVNMEININNNKLRHANNLIGININSENFIEYTFLQNLIILILGKPVLINSNLSFQKRNSFWYRDLLITKEILTTLFVKYGHKKGYNKYLDSQISSLKINSNQKFLTNKSKIVYSQTLLSEQTCFNIFESMIQISTQVKHPQLCFPVYFYQRWIVNTISHNYNQWSVVNKPNSMIAREIFVSNSLLESYQYLFLFFFSHFHFILKN